METVKTSDFHNGNAAIERRDQNVPITIRLGREMRVSGRNVPILDASWLIPHLQSKIREDFKVILPALVGHKVYIEAE
jgi:hypothetical protein